MPARGAKLCEGCVPNAESLQEETRCSRADLAPRRAAVVRHVAAAGAAVRGRAAAAGAAAGVARVLEAQLLRGFRMHLRDLLGPLRLAALLPAVVPQLPEVLRSGRARLAR